MKARQAYFDEGYLPYLMNKLTLVKNGNVAPYFPTKMFTVIELNQFKKLLTSIVNML